MNLDRYRKDFDALVKKGAELRNAMMRESDPKEFDRIVKGKFGEKSEEVIKNLPSFTNEYQPWYSEAKALVRQLLPDRISDFTRYYEKPRSRKNITYATYVIEDYLEGVTVYVADRGSKRAIWAEAAILRFDQQLSIVDSIQQRFRSSLFDIRQLAQADLFDSELDAARELARNKFIRAAGALAGVVLERHLKEVCSNHSVTIRKRNPQISDLNDALKNAAVFDTPQWRSIQHLGDLRNLCAHDKESEPTVEQINDLLSGVAKVTKTVF